MYKQVKYINENQDNNNLADIIYCSKHGDYIRIKYEIYFHKGQFAGETKTIFANIDDIECDDLAGFLIEEKYLDTYTNSEDYFDVKSREIFIANWVDKQYII